MRSGYRKSDDVDVPIRAADRAPGSVPGRTKLVTVRVAPERYARWAEAAEAEYRTVAEMIREAVDARADRTLAAVRRGIR